MATAALSRLLSTLFLATIVLNFPRATLSDEPCQYPCYPPPIGGTVTPTTPSTIPPPSPQTGSTGSYPPPATGGVYPTPYYPYNPPPYGGGSFGAQPPPDPILPYFPFYYKQPLHRSPDDQSSSARLPLGRSTSIMMTIFLFFYFYYFP